MDRHMDKLLIAILGLEGGGFAVYGKRSETGWLFWRESTSMDLDENDDDIWHAFSSDPVRSLDLVLPDGWTSYFAVELHPDFRDWFRNAYDKARTMPPNDPRTHLDERRHQNWLHALRLERKLS